MNRLANCLLVFSFLGFVIETVEGGEKVFASSRVSWLPLTVLVLTVLLKLNYFFGAGADERRSRRNEVTPWLGQERQWKALRKTILIATGKSRLWNTRAIRRLRLRRACLGNALIVDRAAKLLLKYVADPASVAMPSAVTQETATCAIDFLHGELTRIPYAGQLLPTHVELDDLIEQRALGGLRDRTIGEVSRDRKSITVRSDVELRKQLATFRAHRLRNHQELRQGPAEPSAIEEGGS
jgi:hypothetical protein